MPLLLGQVLQERLAPLRDELIGPSAKKIMQSATGLGYPWRKLGKFIYQDKCAPGHFPDQAQWNATEYITEAIEAGAAMLNGADVKRVILSGNAGAGQAFGETFVVIPCFK